MGDSCRLSCKAEVHSGASEQGLNTCRGCLKKEKRKEKNKKASPEFESIFHLPNTPSPCCMCKNKIV